MDSNMASQPDDSQGVNLEGIIKPSDDSGSRKLLTKNRKSP
jgi:hypothetical protein